MGRCIDETGNIYGYLTVLKRAPVVSYEKNAKWICQCKCGNLTTVQGGRLRNGTTKSCGCFQKERTSQARRKNLIGQRFGRLAVLEEAFSGTKERKWKCQCDCGAIVEVQGNNLVSGHTQSCGCSKSHGEDYIRQFLIKHNINFKTEYIFKDLKDIGFLRFDFAIFNNENQLLLLIEFDGEQHFKESSNYFRDNLEKRQKRDKIKDNYCLTNNIKLVRISYKENLQERLEEIFNEL